jgi:hypothetical protein
MSENDPGTELESYVRKVQAETRRYVQDLLAENQRLRTLNASLQFDRENLERALASSREELEGHRARQARLERELADAAAENRRYSEEFVVVEQQNSSLANLYVAMSRLHSTLDRGELLAIVVDIVEYLVGCEQMALFEKDGEALTLAASKGVDAARWQTVAPGEGIIGRAAATGEAWFAPEKTAGPDGLTACVPLRRDGTPSGALALYRLLPQKGGRLEEIDHELLDLLGTQAAHALYCAALASRDGKA